MDLRRTPRSGEDGGVPYLFLIATLVGEAGGNILEVTHNRMLMDTSAKSAMLGVMIEAQDTAHANEIRAQIQNAGFKLKAQD